VTAAVADAGGEPLGGALGELDTDGPVGLRIRRPPAATTAIAIAAARRRAERVMGRSLHGARIARRCGIEGNAARTVVRTASGALAGSSSSQSAIR
jgi:hypothetical protein